MRSEGSRRPSALSIEPRLSLMAVCTPMKIDASEDAGQLSAGERASVDESEGGLGRRTGRQVTQGLDNLLRLNLCGGDIIEKLMGTTVLGQQCMRAIKLLLEAVHVVD